MHFYKEAQAALFILSVVVIPEEFEVEYDRQWFIHVCG